VIRTILFVIVVAFVFFVWREIDESTSSSSAEAVPQTPTPDAELLQVEGGTISLDRNFYVVVDGSGSMGSAECAGQFSTRVDAAKWAVKEFTSKSVPADVNLGLFVFDSAGAKERVAIGKNNRDAIAREVDRIRAGGETPLNASIRAGVRDLVKQRNRQLGYGDFYVVVATDGISTDGELDVGAIRYANQHSVSIITIGFCLPRTHALAQGSVSYRNANSPQDLLAAFQETQGESPYFDNPSFPSSR
jgi:hypothetical protein